MITQSIGLDARATGIFFGGTIHDVAQLGGCRLLRIARSGRHSHPRQAHPRHHAGACCADLLARDPAVRFRR
ncbi:hypothetical protein [Pseudaminobacter sp. NGMCC 1.201702]|uniref:hypothetical protein n=1 Tax=Pseudaminobacter sp. NGMCC 1.201702 TaxID=3391825 RepID=UPI0039EEFB72